MIKLIDKIRERNRKRDRCRFGWTVEQQGALRDALGSSRYEWLIEWLKHSDPLERVVCLLSSTWLHLMTVTAYMMAGTVAFVIGLPEHVLSSFIGILISSLLVSEGVLVIIVSILGWMAISRTRKARKKPNVPSKP